MKTRHDPHEINHFGCGCRITSEFPNRLGVHLIRYCAAHAAAPELLAALQAIHAGFMDGSIKWAKPRQADSEPYHPANVLMTAALAKAQS